MKYDLATVWALRLLGDPERIDLKVRSIVMSILRRLAKSLERISKRRKEERKERIIGLVVSFIIFETLASIAVIFYGWDPIVSYSFFTLLIVIVFIFLYIFGIPDDPWIPPIF